MKFQSPAQEGPKEHQKPILFKFTARKSLDASVLQLPLLWFADAFFPRLEETEGGFSFYKKSKLFIRTPESPALSGEPKTRVHSTGAEER